MTNRHTLNNIKFQPNIFAINLFYKNGQFDHFYFVNSENLTVSITKFSIFSQNPSKFYPNHPPPVVDVCDDLILQVSEQSTAWFPVTRFNRADIDPLLIFLDIFSSLIHPVKLEEPFSTVPKILFYFRIPFN